MDLLCVSRPIMKSADAPLVFTRNDPHAVHCLEDNRQHENDNSLRFLNRKAIAPCEVDKTPKTSGRSTYSCLFEIQIVVICNSI